MRRHRVDRVRHVTLVVLLCCLLGCGPEPADETGWLLGHWQLQHDPDGNPADWLSFEGDRRLTVRTPEGERVPGRWSLSAATLTLEIEVEGRRLTQDLTVSPGRDRLSQASGAWYGRVDRLPD